MSRYIGWDDVVALWVIIALCGYLTYGDYDNDWKMVIVAILAFLSAYTGSSMMTRFLSIRRKED